MKVIVIDVATLEPFPVGQTHFRRVRQVLNDKLTEQSSQRHQMRMLEVWPVRVDLGGNVSCTWQINLG